MRSIERTQHIRFGLFSACLLVAPAVHAAELDLGNPDWTVRFDNTVKLGTLLRTERADPALADSSAGAGNQNAGDDNFRKRGPVSTRLDLLSEFDAVYQRRFGLRLSGAAWYDHAVRGRSDAQDPFNGQQPYNEFTSFTKEKAGHKAELLDALVFGGWDLGDARQLSFRLGRHALQWGESLFFGDNAIARAQGPIDIYKLLASPNAQFKEIIRPVPQVSAQLQLSPTVSVGAYYQFRWEADRLPPAGSYFASSNLPWGGGSPYSEFVNMGPVGNFQLADGGNHAPRDSGQFGLQLKWRAGETDLGVYAARYHDKDGQMYARIDPAGVPNAGGYLPGSWYYRFEPDVKVVGASASRSLGDFNVSIEGSVRDDMPLRSGPQSFWGFFPGQAEPRVATGRTAHLNLSWLASFGPSFLAAESTLIGELAWNRVLSKKDPDGTLEPGRTRDAAAIQVIYTPSYRQVLPGLDVDVPLGLRYVLDGRSAVTAWDARGNGNATVGVDATYLGVWQFALSYTHYIGKAVPYIDYTPQIPTASGTAFGWGNSLADRNYVSLSVRRTF